MGPKSRRDLPPRSDPSPPVAARPAVAGRTWIWLVALVVALILLGADSARRLDWLAEAADARRGSRLVPEVDPGSASGYRFGEHRIILPQLDGYHWLLQTERAIAGHQLRLRATDYDNAPAGRAVHWAGFMRWWSEGVAAAYRIAHPELTAPQALERVAPFANTLLLGGGLLLLTPLVALRFGAPAAAALALGSVAVQPFSYLFSVGYLDHHGIAAAACVGVVLLLCAGGAGWVRPDGGLPAAGADPLASWMPSRSAARWWFLGSGSCGAVGLWISAATTVPVLMGLGAGVLAAQAYGPRGASASQPWRAEPELFRVWGIAGAVGSLALYLLEYFPGDVGMRLEVNHPLYALAFFGAGDLLARTGRWLAGPRSQRWGEPRVWAPALLDMGLILALPIVILATGEATFRLTDDFLWALHDRYIIEFLDLKSWLLSRRASQVMAETSLVPLVALPLAAVLWPTPLDGRWRAAWRGMLLVAVGAAAVYAYVFVVSVTDGVEVVGLLGGGIAIAAWFFLPRVRGAPSLSAPLVASLLLTLGPALLLLIASLVQMRWLGVACALWLGATVVLVFVLTVSPHPLVRMSSARAALATLAGGIFVAGPLVGLREPLDTPNAEIIVRDASLWLRRRVADERAVILTTPSATTQMAWFGGFEGIGTLYWENLEGLRATRELYGEADPDSLRARLLRHGVTHIAFFGWDAGFDQLLYAAGAAVEGAPPRDAKAVLHRIELELRLGEPPSLPSWLVPLPYVPPRVAGYVHPLVHLFEIVDEMPPAVALARLALYYHALGDRRAADALARSLSAGPSVPGLAMMAQLLRANDDRAAFPGVIEQLRIELERAETIAPGDRVEAALALGLARDGEGVARQLELVLAGADEQRLRRLRPDRLALLVDVARDLGLDRAHPDAIALAERLLAEGRGPG